eukprot:gene43678-8961_t
MAWAVPVRDPALGGHFRFSPVTRDRTADTHATHIAELRPRAGRTRAFTAVRAPVG